MPNDMATARILRVPVRFAETDPRSVHPFDCERMMVDDASYEVYALQAEDKPAWTGHLRLRVLPRHARHQMGCFLRG